MARRHVSEKLAPGVRPEPARHNILRARSAFPFTLTGIGEAYTNGRATGCRGTGDLA